jgi:hypothetical protein
MLQHRGKCLLLQQNISKHDEFRASFREVEKRIATEIFGIQ